MVSYRDISQITHNKIFDAGIEQYDQYRKKVIPCFDDFYGTALHLIPFETNDRFTVLDLGAGTGLMSALILNTFPKAQITLVDISDKMLSKARERFAGRDNIRFHIIDYAKDPLPDQYHLIVSALSIHHLFDSAKRLLFQKIYGSLLPDGSFIHAEIVKGASDLTEDIYQRAWLDHLKQCDLSESELSSILERMSFDNTALLNTQLHWLHEAGFVDIDCFFKYFNFVVYAGRKLIL